MRHSVMKLFVSEISEMKLIDTVLSVSHYCLNEMHEHKGPLSAALCLVVFTEEKKHQNPPLSSQ